VADSTNSGCQPQLASRWPQVGEKVSLTF